MQVVQAGGKPVKLWVDDVSNVEPQAMDQLYRISRLPFIHKHVAVMPDVHLGKGATVGSVIATKGAVIPAAVGVDIGCGMMASKTNLTAKDLPESLAAIRSEIEKNVPVGFNSHDNGRKIRLNTDHITVADKLGRKVVERTSYQIGTLGGGNHFIEICLDEHDAVWLMLHSGSRNIGKSVADVHINAAKGLMKQYYINLEDPDLAYLTQGTQEYQDYINDVLWCQEYAKQNREAMMDAVLLSIGKHIPQIRLEGTMTSCHHNYVSIENHNNENVIVTRKGAVRARNGELGIIPGSMGTRSYIVLGKGNHESFCSCSHGAGRAMSRSKAKQIFTIDDLKKQTEGVECRKDQGVVDEIPAAYKNIDEVMENQSDLVEVLYTLKQIMCVKG